MLLPPKASVGEENKDYYDFLIAIDIPVPQVAKTCGIFFALPTFRAMANKKSAENLEVSFFLFIFALKY